MMSSSFTPLTFVNSLRSQWSALSVSGRWSSRLKSMVPNFDDLSCGMTSIMSVRPMMSLRCLTPSSDRYSRVCWARNVKKLTTYSARPRNLARRVSSCVATPTGHVLVLHLRIIRQPSTMSGRVPKENSSAPSIAMMITSRAVLSWPSVCRRTWSRRPLSTSVCCASASPISGEIPAKRIDDTGLAPVPPSAPEMTMRSAFAFATPAAMVPTPLSATSFTLTAAVGLIFLRSKINWARSSIE